MKPVTAGAPYTVPPEPSRLPALMLAVAVHAVLIGFLWFGISWQNNEPVEVQAEVWDMSVQDAAAPELPPPPPQKVEPEPEPVKPPPRVIEAPPVERPAPTPPDINLQREKERKEEQKRELAEKREQERKDKELADKKKKDEAEREKKELAKKEAEDKKKADKLAADKAAKDKAAKDKAEAAKLDKMRQDEIKRMAGAMGTSGTAEKSTAPKVDSGYIAAIRAKIKSNTAYGGSTTMPGNPKAVFRVEQLPTGEIMSVRLVKSSGVPEFDNAVENGIKKSEPLPAKKDGTRERSLEVNFSMKDYD